jgi:DNA gyrase subunit B
MEEIQVISSQEAIRKRPKMYIGSTDIDGLQYLVSWLCETYIKKAYNGYYTANEILGFVKIIINNAPIICIEDDDIPLDVKSIPIHRGKSELELYLTTPLIGGTLKSLALVVSNSLSEKASYLTVHPDGVYYQKYERGNPQTPLIKDENAVVESITIRGKQFQLKNRYEFSPDPTIFDRIEYDFDRIAAMLRQIPRIRKGAVVQLVDERQNPPRIVTYYSRSAK